MKVIFFRKSSESVIRDEMMLMTLSEMIRMNFVILKMDPKVQCSM